MMSKGKLFIVSGPSGSGKDTILKEVLAKNPDIFFSISSISRPMRSGEVEGEKYNFISKDEFLSLIKKDMLLEYNEFCGNFYGSPKAPVVNAIEKGQDVILEVDVNGAAQVKKIIPDAVSVFIMPPSYDELHRRLKGRGTEPLDVIDNRMKMALAEIARANEYDYIVVNDVLEKAVEDMNSIINCNRLSIDRQKNIINEVLKNA